MKKILFYVIIIVLFIGCSKENTKTSSSKAETNELISNKIYSSTGCKPTDVSNIEYYTLFVDSVSSNRYLYGSKIVGKRMCFWVAKFAKDGNQLWEIINTEGSTDTWAYKPFVLKSGDLLFGKAQSSRNDLSTVKEVVPVIINSEGKATYVKVKMNNGAFIYSDVDVYDNFFICYPNENTIITNSLVNKLYVQINNNGSVLRVDGEYLIEGKKYWPNDSIYINMTDKDISKRLCFSFSKYWIYKINLPNYKSFESKASLQDEILSVDYYITKQDLSKDTVRYKLYYKTFSEVIRVSSVELSDQEKRMTVGDSYQLVAKILPNEAYDKSVSWHSSNIAVATVDDKGNIKAVSKGKSVITVTSNDTGVKTSCTVNVYSSEDVSGITLSHNDINIAKGQSFILNATITPSTAINKNITWTSSDNTIASVSNGTIQGKALGNVTITAKTDDGGFVAKCTVTVKSIEDFIGLYFSGAVIITYGYVTGQVVATFSNNSTTTISPLKVEVFDTSNNKSVAQLNLGGDLSPREQVYLNITFHSMVYQPKFVWTFTYGGQTYTKSAIFNGDILPKSIGQFKKKIIVNKIIK